MRLFLLITTLGLSLPAAAASFTYGPSIEFAAYRNGERIGTHKVVFEQSGEQVTARTEIDLAVKFMGFTAYRYSLRSRETWSGDRPLYFESSTNDDGKSYSVRAEWRNGALEVARVDPVAKGPPAVTLPPDLLPSTHWNPRQTGQRLLLNAQKGAEAEVEVTKVGREIVETRSRKVAATHYRYQGAIRMDQWFDDDGRWVRMQFVASDGSTIEYVLQD